MKSELEKAMAGNDRFFEQLAARVAAGAAIKTAAELIDCSERHAYRIAARLDFRQRVATLRSAVVNAAVGSLSAGTVEAVTTLRSLLDETNEPGVRLSAAKAVLAAIGPLTELADLRQRLDALEQGQLLKIAQ